MTASSPQDLTDFSVTETDAKAVVFASSCDACNAPPRLPISPLGDRLESRSTTNEVSVDVEALGLRRQLSELAAITDLVGRIQTAPHQRTACQCVADELKRYLDARLLVIALCGKHAPECRVMAVSGIPAFHPTGKLALAAQGVLQETIARGIPGRWPATDLGLSGGLAVHKQFAVAHGDAVILSGLLYDAKGQLQGAWMATFSENGDVRHAASFLRACETPVASALRLMGRADMSLFQRVLRDGCGTLRGRKTAAIMALVAIFIGGMCLPWTYRPRCKCAIEPETRRFVSAPFSGPLEQALVKPGDEILEGQLLARMDGREIRWELAGTRANLHRASRERAGYVAAHDSGQAEVARLDEDRFRIRTALLEHREQNLEIRSPIAGVIVSGNWEDAIGMPIETGKTLFEVAPLDAMVVELAIAEDDFAHVRVGMPVRMNIDAYPFQTFHASIDRIHPRTELNDDRNVFIAEARLVNHDSRLRPGMKGSASITSDRQSLGWILLRRPVAALLQWLGW